MRTKVPTKRPSSDVKSAGPEMVQPALLKLAAKEFATRGFAGARLEAVAAQAGTTRAMIYYYFGGREGLYTAVLEAAYRAIWLAEQSLDIDGLPPEEALRKLVEFRVDYYIEHPDFVSLVAIENQHEACYLKQLKSETHSATPALAHTARILAQGQASGVFRSDVDAMDLYQLIVSLGFFNVANRHTFGAIFKRDWADAARVRRFAADAVLRFVVAGVRHPG